MIDELNKPTLYEKLEEWVDYGNFAQSRHVLVNEIVSIVKDWLPKEQSAAGSQNVYVECTVEGFNDCLNKIKRKLR